MEAPQESEPQFSRLRGFLWPIHGYELKKLVPMLLIFFLVSFCYNVLRTMKDTLVVTAKGSGAEAIPFIKVWVMFPGSILMTYIFTRLSNRFSRETVFYVMIGIFLSYFALFVLFLYPNREALHCNVFADSLQSSLPLGFKGMIAMCRNWTFTIFYAMSELWGNIILFVLFWGFANQVTRLNEAKRFYGLFGVGANLSGIFAGYFSVAIGSSGFNPSLPFGTTAWEQSMTLLIGMVVGAGILTMLLFRWMNCAVLSDSRFYDPEDAKKDNEVRGKLSMRESFRYLLKSKYLVSIALIVLSYNIVINLVEVVWKHEVRAYCPDPNDYNLYMNRITMVIGFIATLSALFISSNSIRKLGWLFTALITPVVLFLTSVAFFGAFFMNQQAPELLYGATGIVPVGLVVFLGSLQNVMSRSAKYTVFDATREMAFVPLSPECKIKGKAVVDGICSRLGKSGGAVIHQSLLVTFSTITASAPYVACFLFAVISVWAAATVALGREFSLLAKEKKEPALSPSSASS